MSMSIEKMISDTRLAPKDKVAALDMYEASYGFSIDYYRICSYGYLNRKQIREARDTARDRVYRHIYLPRITT